MDVFGLDLPAVRSYQQRAGLREYLRVEQVSELTDSFTTIKRISESLSLLDILVKFEHEGKDVLDRFRPELLRGIGDDFFGDDFEGRLSNLMVWDAMIRVAARIDKLALSTIWHGEEWFCGYNEPYTAAGICKHMPVIEYDVDFTPTEVIEQAAGLELVVVGHSLMQNKKYNPVDMSGIRFIADDEMGWYLLDDKPVGVLCILPLSVEPGDGGVYEQQIDFRTQKPEKPDNEFWTDNGEFTWLCETLNWDTKLVGKTAFRIVVPRPEFCCTISNIPLGLKRVGDMGYWG